METALIIDTETTAAENPILIEYGEGFYDFNSPFITLDTEVTRYNPGVRIGYGAMAVHGITNEDVADCPPVEEFKFYGKGCEYLIGHNIDFDWQVVGKPEIKRICTLACARRLWPKADEHKLLALIYWLEFERAKVLRNEAHGVAADIEMVALLLPHIIKESGVTNLEELYQFSQEARIPTIISFGKHKGTEVAKLPRDYLEWGLKNLTDEYVLSAFKRALGIML